MSEGFTVGSKAQLNNAIKWVTNNFEKYGKCRYSVEHKGEDITSKQFAALHLWFRMCEHELNRCNKPCFRPLSGKPSKWREGDFKAGVFKPFIKLYKGIKSTKDMSTKDPSEMLEALTGHIATEHNVVLPPYPSLESMSMKDLLK